MRESTVDQERGIDAQRASILAEAVRRDWEVIWFADEGMSGKDLDRPGITEAPGLLKRGEAAALVVAKLDRLVLNEVFQGPARTARIKAKHH